MENIINSIKTLFSTYGFEAATIILLTIVLVNILKKPIVKHAEKIALRTGMEKSVVTRYITLIPFAVAFLLTFFWSSVENDFRMMTLDYGEIVSSSILYAGLSVATYEMIKKQMQAYAAKSNQKQEIGETLAEDTEQTKAELVSDVEQSTKTELEAPVKAEPIAVFETSSPIPVSNEIATEPQHVKHGVL